MIEWNKVTWYSKLAAVIFFLLVLPLWTFCLGRNYEQTLLVIEQEMQSHLAFSPLEGLQASKTASAAGYSGVMGKATISPTCPVETLGNPCPPKPYNAHVAILNNKGKIVTETVALKDGTFTIFLPPGVYTIKNANAAVMPSLSSQNLTVLKNQITKVSLEFDSGIR